MLTSLVTTGLLFLCRPTHFQLSILSARTGRSKADIIRMVWDYVIIQIINEAMFDDFDLEEDQEYPEELYPVVELSDSILELTEKLETIRRKLDDFEQRYLEADEELRECEGYEIPSSTKLERWQAAIEEMSNRLDFLGEPL